ncbi:MAG: phosphatase PAP2 family protein [Vicinamibacteria bacterium]|nr:phosphatase PAP2 family protein [Vicinamibacteria bacterium]
MSRLPVNLGLGIVGIFHRDTLGPLLIGGIAAFGSSSLDQEARDRIRTANPDKGWAKTIQTLGSGPWSTAFVASLFTVGRITSKARFRATTYDMLDAVAVNAGYTEIFKIAVGRERPDGSDKRSFPSGHASTVFTLAEVTQQHYGWKVGAPAYLLAGLVGASRIRQDRHRLSDVVAGATLGYIVGRTVVRVNSQPMADGSRSGAEVSVAPIMARHVRGLQMSLTF